MLGLRLNVFALLLASSLAFTPNLPERTSSALHMANDESTVSRRAILQSGLAAAGSLAFFGGPSPSWASDVTVGGKIQYGDESIMSPKAHGTSEQPVQSDLLYGVSNKLADKICNFK